MKTVPQLRAQLAEQWRQLNSAGRKSLQLMEVCGTHTVAASRGGLHEILPAGLRLVSGPGCPVCVTDQTYMDRCVHLARNFPQVVIASYGDMLRVPGKLGSLEEARSAGAAVEIVYAAHEAVALAQRRPDREVVFLGVGFETTTPGVALAVLQARTAGVRNFSVLSAHKLVAPAMRALLGGQDVRIDGYLCPGHVSVILGWRAYQSLVDEFRRPCVVAGFDEEQILLGVSEILRQIIAGSPAACTVYPVVSEGGNARARQIVDQVFEPVDTPWRALGVIPKSGLALRAELADFDAARRFSLPEFESYELPGCRCGQVITGRCLPTDCPLFGSTCTPARPVGPCMVASEGTCQAFFKYRRTGKAKA